MYKNLLKEVEASLLQRYNPDEVSAWMKPMLALLDDRDLWNHTADGLAVLCSGGHCHHFAIPMAVPELAVVADSFHLKPLRRYLQSADRYQVLGLSLHDFQVYEGNRHALAPLELGAAVQQTIKEVLGAELTEEHLQAANYGGADNRGFHGHGSRKDELDKDAERFFRQVARIVHEHVTQQSGLPLLLAALPEHHHLFRKINKNPMLLAEGLPVNPKAIGLEEAARRAWQVLEPQYLEKLDAEGQRFQRQAAQNLGSDDLSDVGKAAAMGRVDSLLVEARRQIAGKVDAATGAIQPGDLHHPEVDDLLDDLATLVEESGGRVLVVPPERMPTRNGAAATYRY